MQTPQQFIDQMLESARNEGRQEIRDAVMAALGADKLWSPKPNGAPQKNGRAPHGATRCALLGALTKRDGQTMSELAVSTGIAGTRLWQGVQNAITAKAITGKGPHGSRRYYLAGKARAK